jgi:hypothetical protein
MWIQDTDGEPNRCGSMQKEVRKWTDRGGKVKKGKNLWINKQRRAIREIGGSYKKKRDQ